MRRDRRSWWNSVASAFASTLQTGLEPFTSLLHVWNGLEETLSSRNGLESGTSYLLPLTLILHLLILSGRIRLLLKNDINHISVKDICPK
jgi:hypothetical protein